jgi:hypothetical protein
MNYVGYWLLEVGRERLKLALKEEKRVLDSLEE